MQPAYKWKAELSRCKPLTEGLPRALGKHACSNLLSVDLRLARQVVSPIFRYLAAEIDKKGGSGMEISRRVGYDDANECFCRVDCIR